MAAKRGEEMTDDMRITRLEESEGRAWKAIESLAEKQEKLDDSITLLLEAQIKTEERFRETDARMRETDARLRETDERLRETDRRMRETDVRMRDLAGGLDERIGKLVSAIGEFVRKGQPINPA